MEAKACQDRGGTEERFFLGKGGIWAAESRRKGGMSVTCRRGCLWVTWEAGGDRILEAGESVRVDGAGLVVIQGTEDSQVEVCRAGGEKVRWIAALRDFAAGMGLRYRLVLPGDRDGHV